MQDEQLITEYLRISLYLQMDLRLWLIPELNEALHEFNEVKYLSSLRKIMLKFNTENYRVVKLSYFYIRYTAFVIKCVIIKLKFKKF